MKNNEVLVEGNNIKIKENNQIKDFSNQGSSSINNKVFIKIKNFKLLDKYEWISTYIKSYGYYNSKFCWIKSSARSFTYPDYWNDLLTYCELTPTTNITADAIVSISSLEEFEQLKELDSNNRPFKIITEEEFYKDLTEEEARKIASEL